MALPDVRIETVRGALAPGTVADVRSIAAAAATVDGVAPLSEQPLLRLDDAADAEVVHLIARDDDGVVGYAQLDLGAPDDVSSELVVAPSARRRGIGTALLARLDASVEPPRHLAVWAHGDLPAARALAAQADLPVVRELWQMRLDLTGRPTGEGGRAPPPPPAGGPGGAGGAARAPAARRPR
ncbi:MAG: GNAT family N-acetyltransferase, partial [Cellulomonas sp.]|nr:GNAT family N-acetyltransferase [Cellulomonas sp.]